MMRYLFDLQERLYETIKTEFEADLRSSEEFCVDMWCALANVDWYYKDQKEGQGFTFREAGGVIAEIRDEGCYMDWYCSGPDGVVSENIAERMAKHGWVGMPM